MNENERILRLSYFNYSDFENTELFNSLSPISQEKLKQMRSKAIADQKIRNEKLEREKLDYRNKLLKNETSFNVQDMLSVNQIGWINCDRMLKSHERPISNNVEVTGNDSIGVIMILPTYTSCLAGIKLSTTRFLFNNIPHNEEIILVCDRKIDPNTSIFELIKTKAIGTIVLEPKIISNSERDIRLSLLRLK